MNRWLHKKLKLSHHRRSGRLLPRKHSSHGVLMILILVSAGLLVWAAREEQKVVAVLANNNITVSGVVPGPPPDTPPIINQPQTGDKFDKGLIDITGTIPGENIVEIYTNGIFAGAAGCVAGSFNGKINLIAGNNEIKARQVDNLNQRGPLSQPFSVSYLPKLIQSPLNSQFYLMPSAAYFGTLAGQNHNLQATLLGGQAPYAVHINWGDGSYDLLSLTAAGPFEKAHKYQQSGCFVIEIKSTDAAGKEAFAQTVVVVGGKTPADDGALSILRTSVLDDTWPLFVVGFSAVSLFWLGEAYELQSLKRRFYFRKK